MKALATATMREDSLMGAEVDATEFTREDRKRHRDKVRKGLDVLARKHPTASSQQIQHQYPCSAATPQSKPRGRHFLGTVRGSPRPVLTPTLCSPIQ